MTRRSVIALLALAACSKVKREGEAPRFAAPADGGVHVAERTPDRQPATALLRYLPATATFALVADLTQARKSPLHDTVMAGLKWPRRADALAGLVTGCGLDQLRDVDHVLLGGPMPPGGGDLQIVLQGRFDEATLMACIGKNAAARARPLTITTQAGHHVYAIAGTPMVLTFVARDTAAVARSSELPRLLGAPGPAPPALLDLTTNLDTQHMAWLVVSKLPNNGSEAVAAWATFTAGSSLEMKMINRFPSQDSATKFVKMIDSARPGIENMFGTVTVEAHGPLGELHTSMSAPQIDTFMHLMQQIQ